MNKLPLLFACSGCTSAGQMANWLAVNLDRQGRAEMSCIAAIGGGVDSHVRKARRAASVVAIDGCPLHCCLHSLEMQGVHPARHVDLSEFGVRKEYHWDFSEAQAGRVFHQVVQKLGGVLAGEGKPCQDAAGITLLPKGGK